MAPRSDAPLRKAVCRCCAFAVFITAIILFAFSFAIIRVNEIGIRYDMNAMRLDESSYYSSGRYCVGLGHKFIKFPTTVRVLDYSTPIPSLSDSSRYAASETALAALSRNGQRIHVSAAVFYRLLPDKIIKLYKKMKDKYEEKLAKMAQEVILAAISDFDTSAYYTERRLVKDVVLSRLKAKMEPEGVEVSQFNMRSVDFSPELDAQIEDKMVVAQTINTVEFRQQKALIDSRTKVIERNSSATMKVIRATASADATVLIDVANASARAVLAGAEGPALNGLKGPLFDLDASATQKANQIVLQYALTNNILRDNPTVRILTDLSNQPLMASAAFPMCACSLNQSDFGARAYCGVHGANSSMAYCFVDQKHPVCWGANKQLATYSSQDAGWWAQC